MHVRNLLTLVYLAWQNDRRRRRRRSRACRRVPYVSSNTRRSNAFHIHGLALVELVSTVPEIAPHTDNPCTLPADDGARARVCPNEHLLDAVEAVPAVIRRQVWVALRQRVDRRRWGAVAEDAFLVQGTSVPVQRAQLLHVAERGDDAVAAGGRVAAAEPEAVDGVRGSADGALGEEAGRGVLAERGG